VWQWPQFRALSFMRLFTSCAPIDFPAVGKRNMQDVSDRLWAFAIKEERQPGRILYARRTWASPFAPIQKYILSLRTLHDQSVAGLYASGLMRARRLNNSLGKRIPSSGRRTKALLEELAV
jgi:hypothetical protein